ncbi:tRNA-2-methylthio-N(6)-dimethylallyladenosine synthase [Seminavis robusta]|uniref:tRNA-2-methylthio-N(6)-dimethylallyladenosine synthase n=1 Tax=Seminavis robusta TaxID=568900 RepID=A0A9N8HD45_9STRA|nr:tRNA-2-methylthio-N(6)-dimethylallyladenosine synthase [Seminavis robusta]|eukprot:Sro344_g122350.1 tRNA-2-methylthio-N(6)-dimethylallyladenosine synthase (705) ;mRNA; r:72917-75148
MMKKQGLRGPEAVVAVLGLLFQAVSNSGAFSLVSHRYQHHHHQRSSSTSLENEFQLSATVAAASELEAAAVAPGKQSWFPSRIQESLDYSELVQSLYLRHIVTETKEMADLALKQYLNTLDSSDPFGQVASILSACAASRDEQGKIGWVDNFLQQDVTLLPSDVVQKLYLLEPKAGDVHILQSTQTKQFHVVLVEELLVRHAAQTTTLSNTNEPKPVGAFSGRNAVLPRRKLPGKGVVPTLPSNWAHKKYRIETSGCQMNVADSERLAGVLEHDLQMDSTDASQDADVIVINTCSIRDHAEQKLYDKLGPYAAQKRNGRQLALIVTGCVAQQEGEKLLKRVPELDCVLGPQYVPFLPNVLESVEWGRQVVATAPMLHQEAATSSSAQQQQPTDVFAKPVRGHSVRAWVNVINGCNEHCTYCVVPATRGTEQSRTMEHILQECLDLAANGYKEVTLLGQNIDAYGRDMVPKRTFAELLEFLNHNLPPKFRVRYVTSHPRYFSNRVIDAVANLDKVCECFHMPFQAGDDQVLKRMRRGYTFQSYMKIIDRIRDKAPDASISADVIVGFPGETDEAFEKTLAIMERVKFDNLNSFAYSPRPNTEAALWTDQQVPEHVKAARLQRVQALATQHGLERSQRYVGRTEEILVEDVNPRNPKQVMGRTRQGRQVYFDGEIESQRGELVQVLITEARTWSLIGELVDSMHSP